MRGRGRSWGAAAALGVVLATAAAVVLSNPRHRAFYFGERGRPALSLALPESLRAPGLEPATERTPVPTRTSASPDADGRIVVPVADPVPWRLPAEGVPLGWELKEFSGRADVELVRNEARLALRLRSAEASFALYRDVVVDLDRFPYLSWWWKVVRLPPLGDVRQAGTDDQAAQVYVIFPRWPSPRTSSDVIGYVWDSRAPVGTSLTSTKAGNVRVLVVESGAPRRNTWQRQQRNVAADYVALFGRRPPRVGQVAVMIDTDDTRSHAEALIAGLAFAPLPGSGTEIPAPMLR